MLRRLILAAMLVVAPAAVFAQARDEIREIAEEFGGIYNDSELQRYVGSIGKLLAAASDAPQKIRSFTILDSEIVNAFSVPSGDIFVSRGLIALANNEAELASVLGHEIGHVTAGHGESRQTRGVLTQLGAGLLGMLLGNDTLGSLAGVGAQLYLQRYSREQEFEADTLGIRFMGRAGYDQRAAATLLASLEAESRLESLVAGSPQGDAAYNIMADHPRTQDRVQRATEAAGAHPPPKDAMLERDIYLRKVDGLLYGDNPDEGVVRNRLFIHPKLGFAFEVPPGFHINNGKAQVTAQGPGGAALVFDRSPKPYRGPPDTYIVQVWAPQNAALRGVQRFDANGLEAATAAGGATTKQGQTVDIRFVAIRAGADSFYRFLFISPPEATPRMDAAFRATALSFHRMTEKEAAMAQPQRLRIRQVRAGESVEGLAAQMPFDQHRLERFLVLNGLPQGAQLQPGSAVKMVVEGGRR